MASENFDSRDIPVYVTSVSFHGLRKTSSDFLKKQLTAVVKSTKMSDLLNNSTELKKLLLGLQTFNSCEICIDTDKRSGLPDAYNVEVYVEEKKPNIIKAQWSVNTDGTMRLGGHYCLNNIFHKAERFIIDVNAGRDASRMRSAMFIKPLEMNPNIKISFGGSDGCFDHWWSNILRNESTIFADISAQSRFGFHKLQWSSIWREIESSGTSTPFNVRLEAGNSLRYNFLHQFEFDTRSDRIFPDDGALLRLTQELAFISPPPPLSPHSIRGLDAASSTSVPESVGDHSMQLRLDSMFQLPFRLTNWLIGEITLGAGLVHSLSAHPVSIVDRFFMGGPLDLRGYKYFSVGPSAPKLTPSPVYTDPDVSDSQATDQEKMCPVGALGSMIGGLHLYSPLPLWGEAQNSMGSLFRLHAFAMAGSLLSDPVRAVRSAKSLGQWDRVFDFMNIQPRYVLGAGLILRFASIARLELNYCVPLNPHAGDSAQPGFQIGVGVSYM